MNAITKLICILIIFSIAKPIIAQHQKIKISYEPTADGYDFYADNSTQSPYLIKINFTALSNLRPSFNENQEITVMSGRKRILSLKQEVKNQRTNFNFKWSYRKGYLPVKLKVDYPYLIPLKEQRVTKAFELKYIGEVIGKAETKPTDGIALVLK